MESKRVGGAIAIAGGVLALVGNLLHPRYDGQNVDIYQRIAASDRYVAADFVLLVALVLVVIAVVSIARCIGASTVADYGRLVAVVGGTIAVAQIGLETFALRYQAEVFAGAAPDDRVGSFWAANAIDHVNTGLFNTWTAVFLGLAPVLIGAAALRAHHFRRWINGVAVVGGVLCFSVGSVNLGLDDQNKLTIPFLIGSLLVTLWVLAAGSAMIQRADN